MLSLKNFFCCLLLILAGCSSLHPTVELPVRTLARTDLSQLTNARQMVVRDAAAWEQIWQAHTGSGVSEPLPPVDFSVDMVAFVSLGTKNTGGYDVEITGARLVKDHLQISVRHRAPANESILRRETKAPAHFVALPQSNLKPEFILDTSLASP